MLRPSALLLLNDPAVEVSFSGQASRPPGTTRLNTEAFEAIEANVTKHYKAITLPTMSTGATDMAYLRAKGIQCYGVGPAIDFEDGPGATDERAAGELRGATHGPHE